MKLSIHRIFAQTLTVSALGMGLVTPGLIANPALALPEEQIVQQREAVLAFVLEDENGPLAAADGLLVFVSLQSASDYIAENRPNAGDTIKVVPTNLERIHQVAEELEGEPLQIVLVPEQAEVEHARTIDPNYQGGVPLFYAQLPNGAFAPLWQPSGEAVFPMYFSHADLDESLASLPQEDLGIKVAVIPLQVILREIHTSDNEMLSRIRLLPAEVVDAIRAARQEPENAAPPASDPASESPASE
ncbi:MAG: Tic22 family protein [Phormidesmis sp.]